MAALTRQSKKDELWAEVQRLRQTADAERARMAVLESEVEKLRADHGLLSERAHFVEELSERLRTANERLEILASLTRELASFDLDGVLEVCVQRIPYLAGARFASVYLLDHERNRLVLKHTSSCSGSNGRRSNRSARLSTPSTSPAASSGATTQDDVW